MRNFREYRVWQLAQEVAVDVYEITETFDSAEKYGITSQIRRAAVSISSNVAEGCSRTSEKEFARFVEIAAGSAFEVESILSLCVKLKLVEESSTGQLLEKLTSTEKQLNSLRSKLLNK